MAAIACIAASVGLAAGATAASAASWSGRFDGVEYGWVNNEGLANDFLWLQASDATIVELGAGQVASVACNAIFHSNAFGPVCRQGASGLLRQWISSQAAWTNHGIKLWFYPWRSPHLMYWHY
jgi:hypothetical protein